MSISARAIAVALAALAACVGTIAGCGTVGVEPGVDASTPTPADVPRGGTDATSPSLLPVVLSFTATPPGLPMGGGQTTLTWRVQNAVALAIDPSVGPVTGESRAVSVATTTVFRLTATNANGSVTASTAVVVGSNPSRNSRGYVAMAAPTGGESFTAPATLRLVASAYDSAVDTNSPTPGHGANAAQVQFFVDDTMVLVLNGATQAEYNMFKGFTRDVPAGQHRVWARGIYDARGGAPAGVLDSAPVLVTVAAPPTYAQTVNLTDDVVLSGGTGYALTGTAGGRVRLNGNGHRIRSADGAAGALTLQFVDVFDLGSQSVTSQPGVDVTTTGAVTIEDSVFDWSNTVRVAPNGTAAASVRRNTFRSNMRMPIGQFPDSYTSPESPNGGSYPVVRVGGTSTGTKVFAGNNVGAGWVAFQDTRQWVVGGATDADSNVLIGPRVGIHVLDSSAMQVRRNFSHHVYYGGWSQGNNFELQGATATTVEHNVVFGSSWPVRGAGCEFQYNLVLDAGHQWLWASPGGAIHHNVFVGGNNDEEGVFIYNATAMPTAARINIYNNTLDGMLDREMRAALATQATAGPVALASNAFLRVPRGPTLIFASTVTTDYNGFFGTQGAAYSDGRAPAHDVSGADARVAALPPEIFDIDESTVWTRSTTVANVLALYRAAYTPQSGSPLIDAGDPSAGAGNDIGAVGAGTPHAADRVGRP
jgi:hypothetical protein